MSSYNLRRRQARTVDTVPEIQSRRPSASPSEHPTETLETDVPFSTQATGYQTPVRSPRRSSSEDSQRPIGSPLTTDEGAEETLECGHAQPVEASVRDEPQETAVSRLGGLGSAATALLTEEQASVIRQAELQMDEEQRRIFALRERLRGGAARSRSPSTASNAREAGPSASANVTNIPFSFLFPFVISLTHRTTSSICRPLVFSYASLSLSSYAQHL